MKLMTFAVVVIILLFLMNLFFMARNRQRGRRR